MQKAFAFRLLVPGVCVALALSGATGCSSAAGEGAAKGAATGAVGGAVGGALGALLFGGNPLQGAAAGAAIGAGTGAAAGAMAGSMSEADAKKAQANTQAAPAKGQLTPEAAALKQKVGPKNWDAIVLLAECRHDSAVTIARDAESSAPDADTKAYALFIQAVAFEESGKGAQAAPLYPRIAQLHPASGNPDQLHASALKGVLELQRVRREHSLAPVCAAR